MGCATLQKATSLQKSHTQLAVVVMLASLPSPARIAQPDSMRRYNTHIHMPLRSFLSLGGARPLSPATAESSYIDVRSGVG
ncbi:hypothetical protein LMH87_000107 [Akanthomyces muscarius]|uniref:Uncharacterized protein n=1 Tax=Akanthomyces muscarius TaxID=2231603 RepID=A0A9W8QFK0_AKAMU|nr:hypothetical protein LMH87_000107 [Akanthomyces muscarius]KAJ4154831.1 hypothetical protein LMH87_000107 [Akanthomyces muscarius]